MVWSGAKLQVNTSPIYPVLSKSRVPLPEYPEKKTSAKKVEYENRDLVDKIEEILGGLSEEEIEILKIAQFQLAGMRRSSVTNLGHNRFKFEVNPFRITLSIIFLGPRSNISVPWAYYGSCIQWTW